MSHKVRQVLDIFGGVRGITLYLGSGDSSRREK